MLLSYRQRWRRRPRSTYRAKSFATEESRHSQLHETDCEQSAQLRQAILFLLSEAEKLGYTDVARHLRHALRVLR